MVKLIIKVAFQDNGKPYGTLIRDFLKCKAKIKKVLLKIKVLNQLFESS